MGTSSQFVARNFRETRRLYFSQDLKSNVQLGWFFYISRNILLLFIYIYVIFTNVNKKKRDFYQFSSKRSL